MAERPENSSPQPAASSMVAPDRAGNQPLVGGEILVGTNVDQGRHVAPCRSVGKACLEISWCRMTWLRPRKKKRDAILGHVASWGDRKIPMGRINRLRAFGCQPARWGTIHAVVTLQSYGRLRIPVRPSFSPSGTKQAPRQTVRRPSSAHHSTCRGWRMDASVTDIATEPKPSTGKRADQAALCRAGPARLRRRLCHHHPAGLHDGAGLRRRRGRHRRDGVAVGNGAADADRGLDRATPRSARAADLWRRPDGGDRHCVSGRGAFRPDRAGRVHRHHQSLRRRSRRAGSARARGAGEERDRRPPHAGVCPLQPDRRALHRRRLAGGNVARFARCRTAAPSSARSA